MYGADDSLALSGQAAQQAHHRGRHEGVQAACRLVAEQEWLSEPTEVMHKYCSKHFAL